jgi:diguanylate cyclase (GGDEF)-like protein
MVTMKTLMGLESRSKSYWIRISALSIAVIGLMDSTTSEEISMGLFYIIPVSLMVWFVSRQFGIAASILCTLIWACTDALTGQPHSNVGFYFWNIAVRLSFLLTVTFLLSALKESLEHERNLSRTDYVTGAVNGRFFYDVTQMEIERLTRYKHPFALLYVDLDDFKNVNDLLGHTMGDMVLRTVVNNLRKQLRITDIVARLGGDEFAVLLPETGPQEAERVASKMQGFLVDVMRDNQWAVTFSIGVVTCVTAPDGVDEIVKIADELMYSVKKNGKNGIKHSVYKD